MFVNSTITEYINSRSGMVCACTTYDRYRYKNYEKSVNCRNGDGKVEWTVGIQADGRIKKRFVHKAMGLKGL